MPADASEGFHQFHHREELPRRLAGGTGALAARGARRLRSPAFRLSSSDAPGREDMQVGHLARVAERSRD